MTSLSAGRVDTRSVPDPALMGEHRLVSLGLLCSQARRPRPVGAEQHSLRYWLRLRQTDLGPGQQGRQWYARQHDKAAGKLIMRLAYDREWEREIKPEDLKRIYDALPSKCRAVMHMDYVLAKTSSSVRRYQPIGITLIQSISTTSLPSFRSS